MCDIGFWFVEGQVGGVGQLCFVGDDVDVLVCKVVVQGFFYCGMQVEQWVFVVDLCVIGWVDDDQIGWIFGWLDVVDGQVLEICDCVKVCVFGVVVVYVDGVGVVVVVVKVQCCLYGGWYVQGGLCFGVEVGQVLECKVVQVVWLQVGGYFGGFKWECF